jgi:hypothetical protein
MNESSFIILAKGKNNQDKLLEIAFFAKEKDSQRK